MHYNNARSRLSVAEQLERSALLLELVRDVQEAADESGRNVDAIRCVEEWLRYPLPLFRGQCALELMETREGREKIRYLMRVDRGETCV